MAGRAVGIGQQIKRFRFQLGSPVEDGAQQKFAGLAAPRRLQHPHFGELELAFTRLLQRAGAHHAKPLGFHEQDIATGFDNPGARVLQDVEVRRLQAKHCLDPLGVDVVESRCERV